MKGRVKMTVEVLRHWNERKLSADDAIDELFGIWADEIRHQLKKENKKPSNKYHGHCAKAKRHSYTLPNGQRSLNCIHCHKPKKVRE